MQIFFCSSASKFLFSYYIFHIIEGGKLKSCHDLIKSHHDVKKSHCGVNKSQRDVKEIHGVKENIEWGVGYKMVG